MTQQLSTRERNAMYLGAFSTLVPGLIMAGFMPEWNVLPAVGWVAIAGIGSAFAGAMAMPHRRLRGAIAGAVMGAGALGGVLLYVAIRSTLLKNSTYITLELAIGAGLGMIPGAILFQRWVRA